MMSMSDEMISLNDLAASVLDKTREGKLNWKEFFSDSYETSIGNYSIIIERKGIVYTMRLADRTGVEIERVSSGSGAAGVHETLSEIYELARRQALRVDETLLTVKRALDSL
jgi:hypothetical protein